MTSIEWTQRPGTNGVTLNPIRARNRETGKGGWFCIHVNDDCTRCYAETLNMRGGDSGGNGVAYKAQMLSQVEVYVDEATLLKPLSWRSARTIFVCSMTDLFAPFVKDEWIDKLFAVAALCPQHTFIILTKRPKRMREWFERACQARAAVAHEMLELTQRDREIQSAVIFEHGKGGTSTMLVAAWPLPNVWLGTSCGTQRSADEFIPKLLATPAVVRFASVEPMTGPVDLYNGDPDPRLGGHKATHTFLGDWWEPGASKNAPPHHGLDWVICGGESGPRARPMHPNWARSLRDQCAAADVPFFFKQWGEWSPGENAIGPSVRTERTADWDGEKWHFSSITPRVSEETHVDDEPDLYRLGKRQAGRHLDGVLHNAFPEAST